MKRLMQSMLVTAAFGLLYVGPSRADPRDPLKGIHSHNGAVAYSTQMKAGEIMPVAGRAELPRIHAQTQHQMAAMGDMSADKPTDGQGQDTSHGKQSRTATRNPNKLSAHVSALSLGNSGGSDAVDGKGIKNDCSKLNTCKSSAPRMHMNAAQSQQLTGSGDKPVDASASDSGTKGSSSHKATSSNGALAASHVSNAPRMHMNAAQTEQLSGSSEGRIDSVSSGFSSSLQNRINNFPSNNGAFAVVHVHATPINLPSQFYR